MNELEQKLAPLIAQFVAEMTESIGPNASGYAEDIAAEFSHYLHASYAADDAEAKRNLEHLQAQVGNLAAKRALQIKGTALLNLERALILLAQIALGALRITVA